MKRETWWSVGVGALTVVVASLLGFGLAVAVISGVAGMLVAAYIFDRARR